MNKQTISRSSMELILDALRDAYLKMESEGQMGDGRYQELRHLEDNLGALQGDRFIIIGEKEETPSLKLEPRPGEKKTPSYGPR